MKKFTLLLIVMMLVAFGVKAQIPLFSEDFEGGTLPNGWTIVDANSDGFNWRHSSEILGPGYGHNGSDYCMFSQSYDVTYGVLFPDNWLITPAIALTEGATLSFFVCGHDDEYAAEHYGVYISTTNTEISSFTLLNQWTIGSTRDQSPWEEKMVDLSEYAGQTVYIAFRHFNVSNEFYLDLDDVTIWGYSTEPTLQANPATLAFGNALLGHSSAAQTVSVIAANLTTAITATTSAPFEVSADGNTFGSSATLPINGGNLYVRYSPSVSGNENGIVTLSSTGVNDVMVYVSGTGLDCDNIILPLSESFENEDALVCWSIIYTANQPTLSTTYASAGSSSFRFSSMSTATDYNQYLITPELPETDGPKMVTFDYRKYDYGEEKFKVGYSTTTSSVSAFTWTPEITVSSTNWESYIKADIPGNAKYVAIHYLSNYKYYLYVDDFVVSETPDCMVPIAVTASNLSFDHATVDWQPLGQETAWQIAVVEHGEDPDQVAPVNVFEHPYVIEGLLPQTQYDVYVQAECGSGFSDWSDRCSFTTTPDCSNPSHVVFSNITDASAVVSWTAAPYGVTDYVVEYGDFEAGNTETIFVEGATTCTLTDLMPLTSYTVSVISVCSSSTTEPIAVIDSFITIPDCSDPSNLVISDITGTSAALSWTAAPYGVTDYVVEYGNFETGNTQIIMVAGATSCILTGLEPLTFYTVSVLSDCSSSIVEPVAVVDSFETKCLIGGDIALGDGTGTTYYIPVNNLYKYTYSQQIFTAEEMGGANTISSVAFEYGYTSPISAKTNVEIYLGHTTQSSFSSSSNFVTPTDLLLVYSGNLNCHEGWNTFLFDTPFQYNGVDNLVLIVDDNSNNYNNSSYVFKVNAKGSANRSLYYYSDNDNPNPASLATFSGNKSVSVNRNNVIFGGECDPTHTCVAPVLTDVETTANDVTLTWEPGYQESAWHIEYKMASDQAWTIEYDVESPHTINYLEANTIYEFRLFADCGDDEFSAPASVVVRTECDAVTSLPWTENFDSYTASSSTRPFCWAFPVLHNNDPYIENTTYASSTPNALHFSSETTIPVTAVTPQFEIDINTLQITFKLKAESTTNSGTFEVGVCSDPNDMSTFESVSIIQPENTYMNEYTVMFNETELQGAGNYIVFRQHSNAYNWYYWMDDVVVEEIPSCIKPDNLSASDITTTMATVSWNSIEEASDWEVQFMLVSDTDWAAADVVNAQYEPIAALENLLPSSTYQYRVRTLCSIDNLSDWSDIAFFATECDIFNAPFAEDFENIIENIPICWDNSQGTTTDEIYKWNAYTDNGRKCVRFNSWNNSNGKTNFLMTPQIVLSEDMVLTCNYKNPTGGDFSVYISTDNGTTSTLLQGGLTGQSSWEELFFDLSAYTGETVNIIFKGTSNYGSGDAYIYLDDVEIDYAPTCLRPADLTLDAVTSTTATMSWTGGSAWEVAYGPAGFNPDEVTPIPTTDNPYTITDLIVGEEYDAYVRTDCGDEQSEWRGPVYFVAGVYAMPESGVDTVSMCGGFIVDPGGSGSYSANTNSTVVVLPDAEGVVVQVQGTYALEGNCDYIKIYDGIGTNGTMLWQSSMDYDIDADSIPLTKSTVGALTIYFHSDGSVQGTGFEMEVSCETPSPVVTCDVPTNLSSNNVQYNSANITWTAVGSESAWNLQWRAQNGTWTPVNNLTVANYSLNGLTAQTTYEVQVRAVCDGSTTSDWTAVHSFTTPAAPADPCNAPTNVIASNILSTEADINWTPGGNETSWKLQYKTETGSWSNDIAVSTRPYHLTNLTAETGYVVRVKAVCADGESDWSNTYSFTTNPEVGIDNVVMSNSISLMPNPADNYIEMTVNGNVNVKEAAIYNAFGQMIQKVQLSDNHARINLDNYASGMYFVRVAGDNAVATKKFIKK